MADPATLVRRYYAALDGHEYAAFAELLAPNFVQRRPDRTFEGRDAFVDFMREDRPLTDTSHELVDVLVGDPAGTADADRAAVARGRLLDADGEQLFDFADHFALDGDRIIRLETYTR